MNEHEQRAVIFPKSAAVFPSEDFTMKLSTMKPLTVLKSYCHWSIWRELLFLPQKVITTSASEFVKNQEDFYERVMSLWDKEMKNCSIELAIL